MSPKTTTKTKTTRWWWIRHAPVDNPERRLYGQSDIDAIVSDTDDFKQLAKHLPSDGVWVASHLKRTHQTAQAIIPHFKARGHNAPELLTHPELAEQNFGDWQGMTYNELKSLSTEAKEKLSIDFGIKVLGAITFTSAPNMFIK